MRRWFAAALLLVLSVAQPLLADEAAEAADRVRLEATVRTWTKGFNKRDAEALVALTTDDVVLLDTNLAPVSGQAAREALRQAVGVAKGELTNATKEVVISGEFAWRIGALSHKLPGGAGVNHGQSLEIWKRVHGGWRLHRQMSSSLLAAPKAIPRPPPSEPVLDAPVEPRVN